VKAVYYAISSRYEQISVAVNFGVNEQKDARPVGRFTAVMQPALFVLHQLVPTG